MSEESQEPSPSENAEPSNVQPDKKAARKTTKRSAKKAARKTSSRRAKVAASNDDSQPNLNLDATASSQRDSVKSEAGIAEEAKEGQPKRGERDARTQADVEPQSSVSDQEESRDDRRDRREQAENKVKRGRRGERKSGPKSQASADAGDANSKTDRDSDEDRDQRGRGNRRKGRRRRGRRLPEVNLDPSEVAEKAWKIFQAEVAEEGLALIDEATGREAAKRAFKLAESFLIESSRYSTALARAIKEAAEEQADDEEE